jgi:nucleoid DNA-binding protein
VDDRDINILVFKEIKDKIVDQDTINVEKFATFEPENRFGG